ncbi:MAG: YHS domain-containing (seleno)protein [Pseudomonadota bacterium]
MTPFKSLIGAAILAAVSGTAFAGPQYLDDTGFAVSGYDVVAYHDLPQSPVGEAQVDAVPGRADITADYNGATFAFSTEANRDRFLEDPAAFAPAYDGHCAYGVSKGGKVPGNPNLWRIVDGTLYLNITPNVVNFWNEDIPGNLKLSEANWVDLEPADASDRAIPEFSSPAPIN